LPPLREDKGEGVGRGDVSGCGRLLGTLEGREWVEQREWEARLKKVAVWAGKVLRVKEGRGGVGVGGAGGQGIQWTQTEEKGRGMGEGIQRSWVFEREGSGKGNIGGKEKDKSTVPKRPAHMGPQTIYGFDGKSYQDQ
jgi:hypothetical protein